MLTRQNGRTWLLTTEVALRGSFAEFDTIEWLRDNVAPGSTVLDVGANVGQMTMESAELAGPGGRVIAVEPAPGNIAVLKLHVEGNKFSDRVTIVEGACSDDNGTAEMFFVGKDVNAVGSGHTLAGEAALRAGNATEISSAIVTVYTADKLCADFGVTPSVVKIDVEGAELQVLYGMTEIMRIARPVMRVAFHPFAFDDPSSASNEFREIFAERGYILDAPEAGPLNLAEYNARPAD